MKLKLSVYTVLWNIWNDTGDLGQVVEHSPHKIFICGFKFSKCHFTPWGKTLNPLVGWTISPIYYLWHMWNGYLILDFRQYLSGKWLKNYEIESGKDPDSMEKKSKNDLCLGSDGWYTSRNLLIPWQLMW